MTKLAPDAHPYGRIFSHAKPLSRVCRTPVQCYSFASSHRLGGKTPWIGSLSMTLTMTRTETKMGKDPQLP